MRFIDSRQAKRIDTVAIRQFGFPGIVLMENAGIRSALCIQQYFPDCLSVTVLCGTGNNGGDGMVIARQIALAGRRVSIWIGGEPDRMTEEASTNWAIVSRLAQRGVLQICSGHPAKAESMPRPDLIVDAMLGISARGRPRSPFDIAVLWANAQASRRVAIDLPTGVDPDTGEVVDGIAIRADLTIAMEFPKKGCDVAREYAGEMLSVSIGLPTPIVEEAIDGE